MYDYKKHSNHLQDVVWDGGSSGGGLENNPTSALTYTALNKDYKVELSHSDTGVKHLIDMFFSLVVLSGWDLDMVQEALIERLTQN